MHGQAQAKAQGQGLGCTVRVRFDHQLESLEHNRAALVEDTDSDLVAHSGGCGHAERSPGRGGHEPVEGVGLGLVLG